MLSIGLPHFSFVCFSFLLISICLLLPFLSLLSLYLQILFINFLLLSIFLSLPSVFICIKSVIRVIDFILINFEISLSSLSFFHFIFITYIMVQEVKEEMSSFPYSLNAKKTKKYGSKANLNR